MLRDTLLSNQNKIAKENIPTVAQVFDNILKAAIKSNIKGNANDMFMPYSDAHRKKIYLGHTLCLLNRYYRHPKFDDYGEIMHDYVIEKIKAECCEILKEIKLEDNPPSKKRRALENSI